MKIHVIDNAGQILPLLFADGDDVTFYSDEIQALNAVEVLLPELILLNFDVRGSETAAYIDLLLSLSPMSNIVVVGDDLQDDDVLGCLLVGAKGYQDGRQLPSYIGKIVRAIEAGEAWISRRMTARLLDAIRRQKQWVLNNLSVSGLSVES
jgi:DNA-binding NarL/FixJ family response regulator